MGLKELKKKKWFKILTNMYVLVLTAFVIWMVFFDTNSLLIHLELKKEIKKLEKTQDFLKKEIREDKKIIVAASLGVLEQKVLLIDADPQANATSGLGLDVDAIELGTYQLLEHTKKAKETIIKTTSPNVDLIPSHIDLVAIEIELVDKEEREYMMKKAILDLKKEYDYILIDCAPSLGLLTLNALTASDSVIIPIQCEYFALEGLGKLLNTIKSIQRLHNPELDIEGMLLTMYDSRLRLSNQVVEE